MRMCVCSCVSDSLQPHELYSLLGSSVHGVLQTRILEWVAISFSGGSSQPRVWTLAGRFLTTSTTWEVIYIYDFIYIYIYKVSCNSAFPEYYFKLFILLKNNSQGYSFSSSHVWMWELDCKESWAPKNWCFWTVVLKKTLESPLDCRRSNQSILKEISPEYSLEGLMLRLKLQYFGHLMWRTDSWEKTLMLGKIEGGRRRGQQRIR